MLVAVLFPPLLLLPPFAVDVIVVLLPPSCWAAADGALWIGNFKFAKYVKSFGVLCNFCCCSCDGCSWGVLD